MKRSFEFAINTLIESASSSQLELGLTNAIGEYGYHTFVITGVGPIHAGLPRAFRSANWPVEYSEEFVARNLFLVDPVTRHIPVAKKPFTLREAMASAKDIESAEHAFAVRAKYNIGEGFVVPLDYPDRREAICFMCSEIRSPDNQARIELACLGLTAANAAARVLRDRRDFPQVRRMGLTERESEILRWAALGRTSMDVAELLSLSESAINKALATAQKKLGAQNRVEAVATAIRNGAVQL